MLLNIPFLPPSIISFTQRKIKICQFQCQISTIICIFPHSSHFNHPQNHPIPYTHTFIVIFIITEFSREKNPTLTLIYVILYHNHNNNTSSKYAFYVGVLLIESVNEVWKRFIVVVVDEILRFRNGN